MIHQVNKARLYDTSYEALPPSLTQLVLKLWSSQWRNEIPSFSLCLIFWQRKVFPRCFLPSLFFYGEHEMAERRRKSFAICCMQTLEIITQLLRSAAAANFPIALSSQIGFFLVDVKSSMRVVVAMLTTVMLLMNFNALWISPWALLSAECTSNPRDHLFQFRSNKAGWGMIFEWCSDHLRLR